MKLLLVAAFAVCLGQLQAAPLATPDGGTQFYEGLNNLLGGDGKEALESLSQLGEHISGRLQSVEDALAELETLYNEKVLKELEKHDAELETNLSPCFTPIGQEIRDIVEGARDSAGQCTQDTLARVKQIEQNIEEHVNLALDNVQEVVAIGTKCLSENNQIVDQINCALQNAPEAVNMVQEMVQDAATLLGQISREVSELASATEQCLAESVQDAVVEFNNVLEKVINCLGGDES